MQNNSVFVYCLNGLGENTDLSKLGNGIAHIAESGLHAGFYRLRVQVCSIGELDALLEMEGVGQTIVADLPGLRKGGDNFPALAAHERVVAVAGVVGEAVSAIGIARGQSRIETCGEIPAFRCCNADWFRADRFCNGFGGIGFRRICRGLIV